MEGSRDRGIAVGGFRDAVTTRGLRGSLKALLLAGCAVGASAAHAQDAQTTSPAANTAATSDETQPQTAGQTGTDAATMNDIVVTGNTSGRRTLFNSSSDVTLANAADLQRKAPRTTAEALELVPGIFVEGTAGPVSNNYSVRGLSGGAQTFIQLEEDGMPILYSGGGDDEYFQNDITIDRMEAVEGGTSGVLAVNGAAATINFISLKPSYDKVTSLTRFTGTSYGTLRADGYFSAPIANNLAFSVGGYVSSDPGYRSSSFDYNTYHIKAMLEKRFDSGGYIRFTIKKGDEHDAYYADMPFRSDSAGNISDVPGLNGSRDNIGGRSFANISVPDSCATGTCSRNFSMSQGIHTTMTQYRLDVEKPVSDKVSLFARARYLDSRFDFNGIFPGSTGQAPLAAGDYLNPATSPIANLMTTANDPTSSYYIPGIASYGLRDTRTGQIITAANTAGLSAIGGNGLLEETVLNHQVIDTKDFGSDFGAKFDFGGSGFDNSLTVGGMYYNVEQRSDQSATATVINSVSNNSSIYDVVALNGAGDVIGQLTNNGMVNYGTWGQGVSKSHIQSTSAYFNDELKIGEKLHIDFGARYEHMFISGGVGNAYTTNPATPAGTPGVISDIGGSFDGTYTLYHGSFDHVAYTAGVNYELTSNFALYARFAKGFQSGSVDTGGAHPPAELTLYEAGVRFQSPWLTGSLVGFRTEFRDQSYTFTDPSDPTVVNSALADDNINGIQLDAQVKPVSFFNVTVSGVYQNPKLTNLRFEGVAQPQYEGNVPERTPKWLLSVTPAFELPGGLGEIYGRYKYIGKIFADAGNGVALPAYGVFTIGASFNVSKRINLNVSVDNLTNADGYTEGNPRQGQTQTITNGYFYGRSIVGRNALASVTFKF